MLIPQTQQVYTVTLSPLQGEGSLDYLDGEIYEFDAEKAFLQLWMPVFRRNCWLSGCPLQASAHEKAEWIRGFTSAEIEAWDLKF